MSNGIKTDRAMRVFYSYSHKDEKLKARLVNHLMIYEHLGIITTWHDRKIVAGQDWDQQVNKNFNDADIILLLISSDFLSSSYCYGTEMVRALERHESGDAHTIPIILRPCAWKAAPFGMLKALPADGKPVTTWQNQDEALKNIALGIREIIEPGSDSVAKRGNGPAVAKAIKAEIPLLMPYLCDRADQEENLEDGFQDPVDKQSQRPFICLIQGHEDECPDMYKEQMRVEVLPDILKPINRDDVHIEPIFLELPKSYNGEQQFIEKLRHKLAERIISNQRGTDAEIAGILSKRKAPVMTHAYPRIRNWESEGPELVKAYMKYWNDFPDLPPGPRLINCLFFIYKGDKSDEMARRCLNEFDFSAYPNIHAIRLQELSAIAREDVEEWFRDDRPFTGFCANHPFGFCRIQEAIEDLSHRYQMSEYRNSEDEIPMRFLAKEVKQVLERNRC